MAIPDKKKALENFIRALNEFQDAALKLNRAWEHVAMTDSDRSASFSTGYPFDKSFDELVLDIIEWRHLTEKPPDMLDWSPEE